MEKRYFKFIDEEALYKRRNEWLLHQYNALIYGSVLSKCLKINTKLDNINMNYTPKNELTVSYLIYVFGKFEGSDTYKILAINFSKIRKNIIEAKDFDNYKIDCSPEKEKIVKHPL